MKKIIALSIILFFCMVGVVYSADYESGETQASPKVLYGKTSEDVVTAIQVDSDGKMVTSGGSGSIDVGTADNQSVRWDNGEQTYKPSDVLHINDDTQTIEIDGDLDLTRTGESLIIMTDDEQTAYDLTIGTDGSVNIDGVDIVPSIAAMDVGTAEGNLTYWSQGEQTWKEAGELNWADATQILFIDGGSFGIGDSSPDATLHIVGDAIFTTDVTITNKFQVDGTTLNVDPDNDTVQVGDFFIADDSANRVGIGTTTPGKTLDVGGNANISQELSVGSVVTTSVTGSGAGATALTFTGDSTFVNNVTISGDANILVKNLSLSASLTVSTDMMYGGVVTIDAAGTVGLPTLVDGMSMTLIIEGANAVDLDIQPTAVMVLDGTPLAAGAEATGTGTAGDMAVIVAVGSRWIVQTNGWTDD